LGHYVIENQKHQALEGEESKGTKEEKEIIQPYRQAFSGSSNSIQIGKK